MAKLGDRAPAAKRPDDPLAWIAATMETALRAQRSGRGAEAAACYRRVLAADPSNFDATHMLALTEYECGRYDDAIPLLRRAIELRPDLGIAKHNLRLIESMPQIEDGVCRDIVPRLLPRIERVRDVSRFAPSAASVHIVASDAESADERSMLEKLTTAFAPRPIEVWTHGDTAPGSATRRVVPETGDHPAGGVLVLFGRSPAQAAWLAAARAERLLLAVVRDEACALVDRVDEASLCDPKPGVVCASIPLAERLGLPRDAVISLPGTEQRP